MSQHQQTETESEWASCRDYYTLCARIWEERWGLADHKVIWPQLRVTALSWLPPVSSADTAASISPLSLKVIGAASEIHASMSEPWGVHWLLHNKSYGFSTLDPAAEQIQCSFPAGCSSSTLYSFQMKRLYHMTAESVHTHHSLWCVCEHFVFVKYNRAVY